MIFASPSPAQKDPVIKEIKVTGNKKVPSAKIIKAIQSRVGEQYRPEKISKDIEKIYALESFSNIAIDLTEVEGGVRLTFIVEEKPLISRIDFKGNKEFSNAKLSKKIELKKGEFFDKYTLQEDTTKLINFYKEEGYGDVQVESYSSKEKEENEMVVTFFITEGNKIVVDEVNLIGVTSLSRKKVRKLVKVKRKRYYKAETLQKSLDEVKEFYKRNGFLKVSIKEPLVVYNRERTKIFITVFIYEGLRYKLKEIDFEGNRELPKPELMKGLSFQPGEIFDNEKFKEFLSYIQERYAEKGYLRLALDSHYDYDDERELVKVTISVEENQVVYINKVILEGNYRTRDYVIRREFLIHEGDPFNIKKIRQTQMAIFRLGFFSDIQIQIDDLGPSLADLIFEVEEQKTGIASLGAGYSYQDGIVGTVQVSETNLFGRGQRLSLLWEFGKRRTSYQISFDEPWIFNKPYSFGASIYNTLRDEEYALEGGGTVWTENLRRGGSIKLGKYFRRIYHIYMTYTLEQGELDVPLWAQEKDAYLKEEAEKGLNTTSSLTGTMVMDTRDNIFDPSRGSYYSLSVQYAGGLLGGEDVVIKGRTSSSWHIPVIWRFVLSSQLRLGAIAGFGLARVPTVERFFIGGADTVRGYDYRTQIGSYEGGNLMMVGNVEYKFPIAREKMRTILQGAFFFDIGGTWREFKDFRLSRGTGENDLRASVGFGIRFHTPAFPIRLDWAYGLDHKEEEEKSQWHFTIGQVF